MIGHCKNQNNNEKKRHGYHIDDRAFIFGEENYGE